MAVSVAQSLELARRPVGFCTLPAPVLSFSLGLLTGILLIVPFTPHPFGSRYVSRVWCEDFRWVVCSLLRRRVGLDRAMESRVILFGGGSWV